MDTDAPHDPTPPAEAEAAALREKLARSEALVAELRGMILDQNTAHAQTAAALVAYGRAVEACDKHLADCEECDGVLIYCAASGPLRFDLEAAQEKLLDMARAAALALRPPGLVDSADPVTRDWHGEAEDQAWKDL
jgi:hypothetical protein